MQFELIRGANDSALLEEIEFAIELSEFTARSMRLKFEFIDPLSISTGKTPDKFRATIVEPNLFISKQSGKTVKKDTEIEVEIPRQFPTEGERKIIEATGVTVEAAASTAGLSQLFISIVMAVSLKAMWNLMNVMQVFAYLRHMGIYPANLAVILESVHNAVSLEPLKDKAFEWTKDTYTNTTVTLQSEELKAVGITSPNLFWSLGIYAFVFIFLAATFLVYIALKHLSKRSSKVEKIQLYLKKKLFFSSAIRYMIESNLKITHNSIFFLAITGSFSTTRDKVFTIFICLLLGVIVLWPFFVTAFLLHNRKRLKTPRFKLMFQSMYLGIKTDNYLGKNLTIKKTECLLYNVVFCLRRLALVVCYLYFKD